MATSAWIDAVKNATNGNIIFKRNNVDPYWNNNADIGNELALEKLSRLVNVLVLKIQQQEEAINNLVFILGQKK
jgi:hypothetical protein